MKYYIIAGEASGDLHASNLIKQIKILDNGAEFRAWGGDKMQREGAALVTHYKDIAFMGFIEVLKHLRKILKNIKFCTDDILQYKPDALILVDYPGFNLRIAEHISKTNIPVYYYISPQIWAWKKNRVHKIKKFVKKMFVILPFEQDFYKKYDYNVEFVGHPLLDEIKDFQILDREVFVKKYDLTAKPFVAVLPGSRKQEISKMLPIMLSIQKEFSDYQFIVAGVSSIEREFYKKYTANEDVKIVFDQTYSLLQHSQAALVTSGTATLETALLQVPEIVCYKANPLSVWIARKIISVRFISLVNLIMDKMIVKELIQNDLNPESLRRELHLILYDKEYRTQMKENYLQLKEVLGQSGASYRTAFSILDDLKKH